MTRRLLILLFLGVCVTQCEVSSAAGKRTVKTRDSVQSPSIILLPRDVFAMHEIPARYRKGVNQASVLRNFETLSSISKKEFETSEEFNARRNAAWSQSPISPLNGPLGLVVDGNTTGVQFLYDADSQRYKVEQTHTVADFCRLPRPLARTHPSIELCVVGILGHRTRTYSGQNAFGVGTEVEEERGTYLSISVPMESPFIKLYQGNGNFTDSVEVPVDLAVKYKTADLRMMLVGEISGLELIDGEGTLMSPRLDFPYDVFIKNKGLPFKLQAAIYFFESDGRILAIRDFRNTE